jgi:hypothetical protein
MFYNSFQRPDYLIKSTKALLFTKLSKPGIVYQFPVLNSSTLNKKQDEENLLLKLFACFKFSISKACHCNVICFENQYCNRMAINK